MPKKTPPRDWGPTPLLLLAEARRTRKKFNIGLLRQLWQATYLRYCPCQLDPWEYYFFQVYLDRYPMHEKKRFVGWRREDALDRAANTDYRELANDKLCFHELMAARGAPLPKLMAVYSTADRNFPGAISLHDSDGLERYLSAPNNYPLFVKPIRGAHGRNVFAIRNMSTERCDLELLSGRRVGLRDFAQDLSPREQGGLLFQELLSSHEAIARLCGDRLSSVRIIVIATSGAPDILSAVWKIPTGNNITDNFDVGSTGNLIAGIDLDSGRVQRVVRGAGWDILPITKHPDTGARITGTQLPDWPEIKALCLEHARHFPGLRLQHWDIALTDRGPVIFEVNVAGGMRTHQIVQQRGILGNRLKAIDVRPQ